MYGVLLGIFHDVGTGGCPGLDIKGASTTVQEVSQLLTGSHKADHYVEHSIVFGGTLVDVRGLVSCISDIAEYPLRSFVCITKVEVWCSRLSIYIQRPLQN